MNERIENPGEVRKIEEALKSFLGGGELTNRIAQVLALACETRTVSYTEVEKVSGKSTEDVLLVGWKWRLLLPVRTSRCGEWDDRLLLAEPGEVYEMPNIVQYLVKEALCTGEWDSYTAVSGLFELMGEPAWELIPELVRKMRGKSADNRVNALEIQAVCSEAGLGDRVDTLIAVFKGSGIMSPKLAPLAEVTRTGSPIYELNPCVFAEETGDNSGTSSKVEKMEQGNKEALSRLSGALSVRFNGEEAGDMAVLLSQCCCGDGICYAEIDIGPGLRDEIVLLACEERLLLPIKSLRGSAWEDRILNLDDNERYRMPRVVKLLVEKADETGEWDLDYALGKALDEAGESDIEGMLRFLHELIAMAPRYEVEVDVMQAVRAELGIEMDMHETLDRFVRSGIMSPRTNRSLQTGSAKYELNPCLYWEA